ncbi:MAG: carbamoyltransferase N-terminal domain-containing protein, partial [bacterium]|nr:carbamoyltransferase N-terminal domain-containing protein [bacterium]
MHILGISCYYHDAAAALLRDGNLVAAAEEERFTRIKHDSSFPENAITFCLDYAGISGRELDYVVFYEKPFHKFERILTTTIQSFPKSWRVFQEAMPAWLSDKLWVKSAIKSRLGIEPERILFVEHHMSHAASAFYPSPFEEAAILTIDGVGEWTTTSTGVGKGTEIKLANEIKFPHSLGLLYSAFTAFLGFKVNEGEYKVMGMAPYGKPRYTDKIYNNLIKVSGDGSFWLDMDYFSYHHSEKKAFNSKFESLFGKPRMPESYFFTSDTRFPAYYGEKPSNFNELCRENEHYADIAASIQVVTEEVILNLVNSLHKETGLKKLCIAGGVGLNSVANGRILRETPVEELFIQPAAGDGGGALGAALQAYHGLLGKPRTFVMEHAYWGKEYSEDETKEFLDGNNISYEYFSDDEKLLDRTVDDLVEGKVVAWFQGRFEWGPRALGNRSILADPRSEEMKELVNAKIKFREPFRPFAPAILEERMGEFFENGDRVAKQYPARYMLLVLPLKENKAETIKAVSHMGTGRLQSIREEWNPRYYQVVKRFGEATGVPVLLNTSFNLRGEPVVNSP